MKEDYIATSEKLLLKHFINFLYDELNSSAFDLERWAARCNKALNKYLKSNGKELPSSDRTWQHYSAIIRPPGEWIRHDIIVEPVRLRAFLLKHGLTYTDNLL